MTSIEISDLVGSRHDSVKRTIETLVEQSVISLPQIEEVKIQRERHLQRHKTGEGDRLWAFPQFEEKR